MSSWVASVVMVGQNEGIKIETRRVYVLSKRTFRISSRKYKPILDSKDEVHRSHVQGSSTNIPKYSNHSAAQRVSIIGLRQRGGMSYNLAYLTNT
jgi:hypothetical protein